MAYYNRTLNNMRIVPRGGAPLVPPRMEPPCTHIGSHVGLPLVVRYEWGEPSSNGTKRW